MEAGQTPPPQSEEELRAQLEEEMRKVRVQDLVLQSVASLVNLTARRIAKEDERDLEQARIGIDAVRSLVDLLEPEPQRQVREALSELQLLYAQASGGAPEGGAGAEGEADAPGGGEPPAQRPPQQGQPSPQQGQRPPQQGGPGGSGLWTPHQRD